MGAMPRTSPAPDLATRLGDITLPEADGADVRLGDLWADAPLVLAHLRHFG